MPYLYRFENKNKIYAFDRCFSPQYTVFKQCPYASHSLVKNAFSLDPHNCKTDWHSLGGGLHYEFSCCTSWKNSIKVLWSTSPAWAACVWHAATLACWACCYHHIALFVQSPRIHSLSSPSSPSSRSQWVSARGTVETVTWVLPQAVKRWWREDDQTSLGVSGEGPIVLLGNDHFSGHPDETPSVEEVLCGFELKHPQTPLHVQGL